ncbi:hypothetical protein BgiBS90_020194 [Biomphalaria glabrata]|nr:hypothetical protein BgiBS90_020194 [Biomphalaria glabrata]
MVIHFNRVWDKSYEKYKSSRHEDKLTIIVSHPHGCSKMIGVGQWMDAYKASGYKKFTYTTPTCPGSSGATVFCLGSNRWGCAYQRVHSGTLKSGANYNGSRYENKKSCPLCSLQQNTEQNCTR